jgi:spoIIIJ-associated protein
VATPSQDRSKAAADTVAAKERQEILSLVDETFADSSSGNRKSDEAPESITAGKDEAPESVAAGKDDAPEPIAAGKKDPEPTVSEPEKIYTEADFEAGKKALSKIVESVVSEATISVQIKKNQVIFNIEGDNAAVLIGKHGQTLKAMQHLVEKIVQKACDERVRVLVDVEQYMEKRRAALKSLATRLADKAKQTGKPTTINRMDAFERKIIHDTLRKDKNVKTRSAGGGEVRNVVIHPGKKDGRPKKASGK